MGRLLERTNAVDKSGMAFELDDPYARSALFKCCKSQANEIVTQTATRQKQQQPLEERDPTILSSCEHHDHHSMTGLCDYMIDMRDDITFRNQRGHARRRRKVCNTSRGLNDLPEDDQHANSVSDGLKKHDENMFEECTVTNQDVQRRCVQLQV